MITKKKLLWLIADQDDIIAYLERTIKDLDNRVRALEKKPRTRKVAVKAKPAKAKPVKVNVTKKKVGRPKKNK